MSAPALGILGGMGPLASTEFVRTIYECNLTDREQEMPPCILYSDPSIPDRTEAILKGKEDEVVQRLEGALNCLALRDVSPIVIACITAHYFLPQIDPAIRSRVLSLIDVTADAVLQAREPHLMFCTNGTRRTRIFERSARWAEIEPYVVLPNDEDQEQIHELLYCIKQGEVGDESYARVERLLAKYQVKAFIAGCTEMHLLTKRMAARCDGEPGCRIADPLLTIARTVRQLLGMEQDEAPARRAA